MNVYGGAPQIPGVPVTTSTAGAYTAAESQGMVFPFQRIGLLGSVGLALVALPLAVLAAPLAIVAAVIIGRSQPHHSDGSGGVATSWPESEARTSYNTGWPFE